MPTETVLHHHVPPPKDHDHRLDFNGNVARLVHDQFSEFDGFFLLTGHGREGLTEPGTGYRAAGDPRLGRAAGDHHTVFA